MGQSVDGVDSGDQGNNMARGVTGFSLSSYILTATLGEFSVYFVISKLLILAYFWATNLTNLLAS